jgi:hypothetical protein
MNIKSLTLSVFAVAAATIAASQASLADTSDATSGPRYIFDPQTFCDQGHNHRSRYLNPAPQATVQGPRATVRAGSMPSGSIIGLSPGLLSKPPAPAIVQTMARTMAAHQTVTPVADAFKPGFGKPNTVAPHMVAALPQSTGPSLPAAARPSEPSKPTANGKPMAKTTAIKSTRLAWTTKHAAPLAVGPAKGLPTASYAPGVGYQAGTIKPVASSGGMATNTAVSGILVKRH